MLSMGVVRLRLSFTVIYVIHHTTHGDMLTTEDEWTLSHYKGPTLAEDVIPTDWPVSQAQMPAHRVGRNSILDTIPILSISELYYNMKL